MLCLSRKVGERLWIGTPAGDVWVTVIGVDRGKVRLGISAPVCLPIYRQEIKHVYEDGYKKSATGGRPADGNEPTREGTAGDPPPATP